MKYDDLSPLDAGDMHRNTVVAVIAHGTPRVAFVSFVTFQAIKIDGSAGFVKTCDFPEFFLTPVLTTGHQGTHQAYNAKMPHPVSAVAAELEYHRGRQQHERVEKKGETLNWPTGSLALCGFDGTRGAGGWGRAVTQTIALPGVGSEPLIRSLS